MGDGFDHKEREKHLRDTAKLLFWCCLIIGIALVCFGMRGCSIEPKDETPTAQSPQCEGGLGVGQTIRKDCPAGQLGEIVLLCKASGQQPEEQTNTCKPIGADCDKITFADHVLPIFQKSCVGCHKDAPLDLNQYDVSANKASEIIRRIYLDEGEQQHMPQFRPSLPLDQKQVIEDWRADGLIKDKTECNKPIGGASSTLRDIEQVADADLKRVDKNDKIFTRWCQGSASVRTEADAIALKKALDKTLNSVNDRDTKVYLTTIVDPKLGLFRFDIRSYDINREQWQDFENSEPLNLISNTDTGKVLRLFTASVKPIVHCENLIDTIVTDADLYYQWLNVPDRFIDLMNQQGVQFQNDIRNFNANFLGFNGSSIALNKSRMLIRHKSTFGFMWNTQDTKAFNNIRERNVFFAPLVRETGSLRIFDFAAGESLWSLPNGGMAAALHDKNGVLQREAPLDVVIDNSEGPTIFPKPVIAIASSCFTCHASGIRYATDQVREKVSLSSFEPNDRNRITGLYKLKASNDANFLNDNKIYHAFLAKLGVNPSDPDPINKVRSILRSDWSASKTGAYLGLTLADFVECLNNSESDRVKDELGPLIRGGTVPYDVILANFQTLIEECQVAEEIVR